MDNISTMNIGTKCDVIYNSIRRYELSIVRVEKYGQIETLLLHFLEDTLRQYWPKLIGVDMYLLLGAWGKKSHKVTFLHQFE